MTLLAGIFEELARRVDGVRVEARYRVPQAGHPVFEGHFEGDPLLPGWVLLALVQRLLEQGPPARGVAGLEHARFRQAVRPGAELQVELELLDDPESARFLARTDGVLCSSGRWLLTPPPLEGATR